MKLKILSTTNPILIKRVQFREVMNVLEYDEYSHHMAGYYKAWIGSTKDEYFSIVYCKGILSIGLHERECKLTESVINYSMDEKLIDGVLKFKNSKKRLDFALDYNQTGYISAHKEIEFKDVLKSLKWKKPRNVKIEKTYHF